MSQRKTDTSVDPLFLDRWSPRAFDNSEVSEEDLQTILDAGRWAPSAFNYQPWRFLFARRGDANWDRYVKLLIPFNQSWAEKAAVLVFVVSETTMGAPEKPNHSHSFDAGAAWAMMAMQAQMLGYHSHGMTGVDFEGVHKELHVPADFRVEAAFVIGRKGDPEMLAESLRSREGPSDRRPLKDIAFAGNFVK